jgi:hypothetical protein
MKIRIYILCYDEQSYMYALRDYGNKEWAKIVHIKTTVLFENIMYDSWLLENYEDWKDFDYIGTISWKAGYKIQLPNIDKLSIFLDKNKFDVIPFYFIDANLINRTTYYHPKFRYLWIKILTKLGYNETQITKNIKAFYCNYWLTTPKLMLEYIEFFKKVKECMDTYQEIQEDIWSNSKHRSSTLTSPQICLATFGKPYYPYHPFIFERIPCFYFDLNATILLTPNYKELYD